MRDKMSNIRTFGDAPSDESRWDEVEDSNARASTARERGGADAREVVRRARRRASRACRWYRPRAWTGRALGGIGDLK